MQSVHISGESRRAYVHVCTCRRWPPWAFPGNAGSADSAGSTGIFAIYGEILRVVSAPSRGILTISLSPYGRLYFQHSSSVRYRVQRIHIPGGPRRVYIHVCTCRGRPVGFPGNAESAESEESAFAQFSGKSLWAYWHFLGWVFNDPSYPLM